MALSMSCPVASRFLKRYSRAVTALREAQFPLLWGLLSPGAEYHKRREAVIKANAAVDAARKDLWQHVQGHGCSYIARTDYSKATKARLRTEMRTARRFFDTASEKYDRLVRLSEKHADLTPSYAGITIEEAQLVPMRAYEVYTDALRRYADYRVFGRLPEAQSVNVPERPKPN